MRCSTNIYLTALAVADIVYLLFVFFLSFKVYKNMVDRKYELYWKFFGLTHWLCDSASNASVWLTVSFTLERYIAVCHPIKGKVLCTENRAKGIIAIIAFWCIATTISTAFERELAIKDTCLRNCTEEELQKMHQASSNSFQNTSFRYVSNPTIIATDVKNNRNHKSGEEFVKEIYTKLKPEIDKIPINCTSQHHVIYIPVYSAIFNNTDPRNSSELKGKRINATNENNLRKSANAAKLVNLDDVSENETCCSKKFTVEMKPTNLGNNKIYQTFMYWYSALFFALVPLVLIATFNCFLVHAVYKSQSRRRKMTNTQENVSMSNENRITVMLISVVFLFLICQTPTASLLIYQNFYEAQDEETKNIHLALGNIFNFLVTVNASTNFIMYCVLSKKYRTTFKSLFCERRKNRQDTLILTSTRTRYSSYHNGLRRNISEYHTPRNL
ncbi:uncharacterized protein BDFB_008730, partial [Asbolus verrucosus]